MSHELFFSYRYGHHRDLHSFPTRRSSDLRLVAFLLFLNPQCLASISRWITASSSWKRLSICLWKPSRSEERFSRNAETDLVCRLLLEKKMKRTCADSRITVHFTDTVS